MEVAASAIAVITLVGNVSTICLRLYGSLGAREELNEIVKELEGLRHILTVIAQLTGGDTGYAQVCSQSNMGKAIKDCEDEVKDIQTELQKIEKSKLPSLSLPWMLKEKALTRRLDKLSRLKQDLQLSMQTDQTSLHLHAQKEDESFRRSFAEKEQVNERRRVIDWLDPASFSSVCDDAQRIRSANTFTWLLESPSITSWRDNPHTNIWLHGIPGCGKTVFASSVVDILRMHCQQNGDRMLAYYFFEFASRAKGSINSFLRSILSQIVAQKKTIPSAVQTLFTDNHEGARGPSDKMLLESLRAVLDESRAVFLVVDAVDECETRTDITNILRQLALWEIPSLHLMVSSRTERDFEVPFQGFHRISLMGKGHSHDIQKYVEQRMSEESDWSKWPNDVQKEIAEVVVNKAEDMFRLAKLHLDALQRCRTRRSLQQTLGKLPSTLDDTYERILAGIDPALRSDALRILCWLCFALRPLTIPELAATLAVDLGTLEYDPMLEYQDTNELLDICGSLVKLSEEDGLQVVKLSHASVKDYLVSGKTGIEVFQALYQDASWADEQICGTCLVYLKAHNYESREEAQVRQLSDPLIVYATNFWSEHLRKAGFLPHLIEQARTLLVEESARFFKWAWIGTFLLEGFHMESITRDLDDIETRLNVSLYASALIGSTELIDAILDAGAQVNGRCGIFDSALAAAIVKGNLIAVKHLLEAGADVNSKAGVHGRVLHLASAYGWVEIVDHLLTAGAAVNASEGMNGTALLAAIYSEDKRTIALVRRLLKAGADPSLGLGACMALTRATFLGDKALVKLLIQSGANVDGGSLHVALEEGDFDMARLLIGAGAKIGTIDADKGTTLAAAASHGVSALRFLIEEQDASYDMVDHQGRNALHIAASLGRVQSVRYLLDMGLQADSTDVRGWSAVHYAASSHTAECLKLLLPSWTLSAEGCTPLHLACRANVIEAVDLLLEAGLRPATVRTEHPAWNWTLLDIAMWHSNHNLVSAAGQILHHALHQGTKHPIASDFSMSWKWPRQRRLCDGCQFDGVM